MRILFCTDGSKISFEALYNFSNWFNDFIVDILSVSDLTVIPDNTSPKVSEFAMYCTKSTDNILNKAEKYLKNNNININLKIQMCGSVTDSILEIENENNYNIILLGSNGKKGLQKCLGSVSQDVASQAKTSVYISKGKRENKKILFATDTSKEYTDNIKITLDNLNLYDKEIHLITVYEMPDYIFLGNKIDTKWINEIENKQKKSAVKTINEVEKIFKTKNNLNIKHKKILKGQPAKEIINYISKNSIDLTVIGMKSRKYLSRFMLDSVSKRVIENANSDCYVIKS